VPSARPLIRIESVDDPRVAPYRQVRDRDWARERSGFMVEGLKNVERLLRDSPFEPLSLLASEHVYERLAADLHRLPADAPAYVAPPELLVRIAGFRIHRGCLSLARRAPERAPESLRAAPGRPSLLVALEGLTNHDNVGGVFRNAMAFGADGVLLCPRCCDPLYRKAIRVSMGGALRVPFARAARWPEELDALRAAGYEIAALHPGTSEVLETGIDVPGRCVLLLGTEGEGLAAETLERVDRRLRIPMAPRVDSLNVATASGIALHAFARGRGIA